MEIYSIKKIYYIIRESSKQILKKIPFFFFLILIILTNQTSIFSENKDDKHQKNNNKMENFTIGAYVKSWYLHEQAENDAKQVLTQNHAQDEASGFSIHRARIFLKFKSKIYASKISCKFEKGTPQLLDAYIFYKLYSDYLSIGLGQMKIPSTYEITTKATNLPFASRSMLSLNIANWSMAKSTSSVSPFTSINTYNRDMGLSIKGMYHGFIYSLMISNGFGANNFVGSSEDKQIIYSNRFGEYLYGGYISINFIEFFQIQSFVSTLCLGGHFNHNYHHDLLYNDTNTVLDIKRTSWSINLLFGFFKQVQFMMLYAKGIINDDIDDNNKRDLTYEGIIFSFLYDILPNAVQICFRYETYTEQNTIFGGKDERINYTMGINYFIHKNIKLQSNYLFKQLHSNLNKDLNDNIFIISIQTKI